MQLSLLSPLGCLREDGGSHVWPIIHPCGVATANCSDYDDAFDKNGLVRRKCTKEGTFVQYCPYYTFVLHYYTHYMQLLTQYRLPFPTHPLVYTYVAVYILYCISL